MELSGSGVHHDEISEYLPGRSPISCRRRYLDLHAKWSEELKKNSEIASDPPVDGLHLIEREQGATDMATSSPASDGTGSISQDDSGSQASLAGSEVSDHSWLDYIALSGASWFSTAESAAVNQLVDAYRDWAQGSTTCNTACAAEEPADAPESSPPESTPPASSGSLPPPTEISSGTTLTPQGCPQKGGTPQKRRRDDEDDDNDEPK